MKYDHATFETPRDEFGDELDNPAPCESIVLLCIYPLYLTWQSAVRLLQASQRAYRRFQSSRSGDCSGSRRWRSVPGAG